MKNKNKRKDGKNTKVKHTMKHPPSRGLNPSHSKSNLYATTQKLLECEVTEVQRILFEAFSPERPDALRADPRAFTMFSTRLRKQKQWEKCIQVFNLQQQLGVERNTISFNAVMSAAIKGKKPKYALELFAEMKKIGLDITTITINVAMQAHLKLNEPNKALELFDALEEKDTVSLNTAMAAAEIAGDDDRLAQLRDKNRSGGAADVKRNFVDGDDNDDDADVEEGEDDSSLSSCSSSEGDDEDEDEEERRSRIKKMKKNQQKQEEEMRFRNSAVDTNDEDDADLALRKRRDARRKKFEEKRRLRKLKKGKERQWTSAAAHSKQVKSALQLKRSRMKGNPKDWLNEESSSSDEDDDEDEEESDTETRMKKWREKVQRKGFKSAIEDDDIDKYINVHSSSHGMDSEDFWRAGF